MGAQIDQAEKRSKLFSTASDNNKTERITTALKSRLPVSCCHHTEVQKVIFVQESLKTHVNSTNINRKGYSTSYIY